MGYGSKAGVVRVEDDRIKGVRTHLPYHPPLQDQPGTPLLLTDCFCGLSLAGVGHAVARFGRRHD